MQRTIPCLSLLATACAVPVFTGTHDDDPTLAPVPLEAAGGFGARLLYAGDVGVWTVGMGDVLSTYGGNEVVALDDGGRCLVLFDYSGRTLVRTAVVDGTWLGGLAHGDADPSVDGPELYVGAQRGNLYQVVAHPQGGFDARILAWFAGREVHSLLVADVDPMHPGEELFVGLGDGEIHWLAPGGPGEDWRPHLVHRDPGRIRQMIAVEADGAEAIAYVSRSGNAVLLTPGDGTYQANTIHAASTGLARIARGKTTEGSASVLYVIGDSGAVLRLARGDSGEWSSERIHAGPIGGRGVATGRFHDDPARESVAIFGYSGEVELLTREDDGAWSARTIFRDLDKGHWLDAGELDDRNATDELVLSGYAGRVVLLARPPGYGLE